MKIVRLLLPVICLTIFGTSLSCSALADTIQQCIAEACKDMSPSVSVNAFTAFEKKDHPDLEEFYRRYQVRLGQIRIARERQVRESLKVLGETQNVTDLILRMSDQELMSLLIERKPWNFKTDRINGELTVVVKPVTSDPQLDAAIRQIFPRFQATSPLYAAQLKMEQLNLEPRVALQLTNTQKIDVYVISTIKDHIAQLPSAARSEYTQKLDQYLSRLESFKNQHGDKAYLWLGDFDLELQVKLGRVVFVGTERSSIEKLMVDDIPRVIENHKDGIMKIDETYSPVIWEKTCRFAYNRALYYGLTQGEKDHIENQTKEALRRSQRTLQGLFGSQITSEIMEYIRTLKISGPLSLPEYVQYIEQNMNFVLEEAKKTDLSLLNRYKLVSGLGSEQDSALDEICNSWIFDPIRDMVSGNNVVLSAYSAKNYSVGLSIVIHEMGHAVSNALDLLKSDGVSIAPYEDIRSCISENYTSSNRRPIQDSNFNGDKLWTEEDWADAFAGHSLQDDKANNMCGFIGANPKFDYATLDNRSGDPHSPTFYRVLNINTHLGNQQPNQCREPLRTEFHGTKFKDCISPFIRNQ